MDSANSNGFLVLGVEFDLFGCQQTVDGLQDGDLREGFEGNTIRMALDEGDPDVGSGGAGGGSSRSWVVGWRVNRWEGRGWSSCVLLGAIGERAGLFRGGGGG